MSPIRPQENRNPLRKPFRLDRQRGKVLGVCAGMSNYFNVDVTILRIAAVLATLVLGGAPILIYLAAALIAD